MTGFGAISDCQRRAVSGHQSRITVILSSLAERHRYGGVFVSGDPIYASCTASLGERTQARLRSARFFRLYLGGRESRVDRLITTRTAAISRAGQRRQIEKKWVGLLHLAASSASAPGALVEAASTNRPSSSIEDAVKMVTFMLKRCPRAAPLVRQ